MINDSRRETLDAGEARGLIGLVGLMLAAPTTPSGAADLNVNVTPGQAVIPPHVQHFDREVDFDCGSAITDGESLPVSVVAAYNPGTDAMILKAVSGTSHTTPATEQDSRAYYPTDAEIEAALPANVDEHGYTVIGTVVFARSGGTVTQHYDHTTRTVGVPVDGKNTSGDDFGAAPDAAAAVGDLANVVSGTATVANGNTSVTVTAATLGGTYGGSPVLLTMAEAPTAAGVAFATWSGDDLVVNIDANNTADLDIHYMVDGR